MPKETFFNIPEGKRNKIINIAIDEFSKSNYHNVSVNKIVKRSEISKGSFYQYFENKLDLFKYIVEYLGEKKLEYIDNNVIYNPNLDFFDYLREIYRAGFQFAINNQKLYRISKTVFSDSSIKIDTIEVTIEKSKQYFDKVIEESIKNGNLDKNINKELFIDLIISINLTLADEFIKTVYEDEGKPIDEIVDEIIYLLKYGAGAKENTKEE